MAYSGKEPLNPEETEVSIAYSDLPAVWKNAFDDCYNLNYKAPKKDEDSDFYNKWC